MKPTIRFNVVGFIDRRTPALHARHDELVEQEWRRRVANHPIERRRLERERILGTQDVLDIPVLQPVAILRRQAS